MRERWRVAILDSGLRDASARLHCRASVDAPAVDDPAAPVAEPLASCRFVDDGREVVCSAVVHDSLGHGTAVAEVICGGAGNAAHGYDLLIGQVLDQRGVTTAAALAAAIHWSIREGANLIHMSLGLREDRQVLAEAVAAAVEAGCIIVASTPARGEGTYPARYVGVLRATGDARCQRDEISDLHSRQGDFGGCPSYTPAAADQPPPSGQAWPRDPLAARLGGASLGAAHVTRFLIETVAPWQEAIAVRNQLRAVARYTGIEDRSRSFKAT